MTKENILTKDDIILMAQEAGNLEYIERLVKGNMADIERLVKAAYAAGAKDERERICNMGKDDRYSHQYVHSFLADILARGEK